MYDIPPSADPVILLTDMLHKQEDLVAYLDKVRPGSHLWWAEVWHLETIRCRCAEVGIR